MIGALALVAGWSFAEGLLFFIVADVPIGWIALNHGWRRGLVAALVAAPAAALGGLVMVLWTGTDPAAAQAALVALPAIDAALVSRAAGQWADGHYLAMARGAFGGVPYKLYAHAWALAPSGGVPTFLLGSIAARLPRFVMVALGTSAIARALPQRVSPRGRRGLFVLCWVAFYAWYFARMGW